MNNINNLSDEEFDDLFRQSAEERNIEFDEGAWQKMSSLLDQKQPVPAPKSNWLRNATALLALILLVSVGVYFVKNKPEIGEIKNIEKSNLTLNKNTENQDKKEINLNNDESSRSKIDKNEVIENDKIDQNLNSEQQQTNNEGNKTSSIVDKTHSIESKIDPQGINEKSNKISTKNNNSSESKNQSNFSKTDSKLSSNELNQLAVNENINKNISKNKLTGSNKVANANNEKRKNISVKDVASQENNLNDVINAEIKRNGIEIKNGEGDFGKNSKVKYSSKEAQIQTSNNSISNKYGKNKKDEKLLSKESNKNPVDKIAQNAFLTGKQAETKANNSDKNSELLTGNTEVPNEETQFTELQNLKLNYLVPKTKIRYKKPNMQVEVYGVDLPMPELPRDEYYKKGLFVRIGISPDMSTISSNKIDKIGSNFGGLLEYRINKKFSAQAGIIKSKKYYDAYPDQYTWIWGYSHVKLVGVAATCNMLDFPVNVRYDMLSKGKTRIFAGLGITTYKMLKETYNYDYTDNTSPTIKWHNWEGKTGTYYASNLNISLGIEKYVSDKLSFQAEPFLKSPLKSIGFGKVPLITYGMMFSAKYPLLATKK